MDIQIREPGLFTTVQDEGRVGYQQYGVSPSGPVDALAFHLANLLVGNKKEAAALEQTFLGAAIEFQEDGVIAVTGADMQPLLNQEPLPMYQAVRVKKGDILKSGPARNGRCSYVAFAGGIQVPPVMESMSTLSGKHLGGFKGRALQAGDRIWIGDALPVSNLESRRLPPPVYPDREAVLRVVPGPQDDAFSREELRRFFWYSFRVTEEFDRMGCRLCRDEPVKHLGDGNIISDGIAAGSIQVPTNGQPIIMLADRQTVGGYAKIGTVISVDLPRVAQCRPGMHVRFVRVGIELAQELYIREAEALRKLEERFRRE